MPHKMKLPDMAIHITKIIIELGNKLISLPVCGSLHPLPLHPFHKVDQKIRGATCICDAVF